MLYTLLDLVAVAGMAGAAVDADGVAVGCSAARNAAAGGIPHATMSTWEACSCLNCEIWARPEQRPSFDVDAVVDVGDAVADVRGDDAADAARDGLNDVNSRSIWRIPFWRLGCWVCRRRRGLVRTSSWKIMFWVWLERWLGGLVIYSELMFLRCDL